MSWRSRWSAPDMRPNPAPNAARPRAGFASNLQRVSSSLVLFVTLSGCALHAPKPAFDLGRFSAESLDTIIAGARELNSTGDRIEFISREFLGIRYREHRLIGDSDTPETLTVNLAALDCYTYLDYVEALRRSTAYSDFEAQLVGVRYKGGRVGWRARRHFLSDWVTGADARLRDVTAEIGGDATEFAVKVLNRKDDGSRYLHGIPAVERTIAYIPAAQVDEALAARLETGDYVGIYATNGGLDVTHAGIAVWHSGELRFRHASSYRRVRRVVDVPLLAYVARTPGIVVYRVAPDH